MGGDIGDMYRFNHYGMLQCGKRIEKVLTYEQIKDGKLSLNNGYFVYRK